MITNISKPFQVKDGLARLIGIPVVTIIMHLTFRTEDSVRYGITGSIGLLIAFSYTVAYWEGIRLVWMKLQQRYGHYSQTQKRLLILGSTVLIYGVLVTLVIQNSIAQLLHFQCTNEMMIQGYVVGLIPTGMVLMAYEMVYFFDSWKNKVLETEAISRTQIQSQLEALKNQLDPHFLFNSLNTLSSLIDENEPAQQYLNRLADVYRYVLLSKDRNTVTLREEMTFVDAYLYLAKVRFQHGLVVQRVIPESALDQMVAPLSVQLLIENALKHNVVTRESPLTISIEAQDEYLWVKNEIKAKLNFESGTKVGLNNILERYKLLSDIPVHILKESGWFEVGLPLALRSHQD